MIRLLLLFAAFWGDTQIREWGEIQATYAVGLPVSNRMELLEFTMGLYHLGIGASIVESYGFVDGEEFIGSLLPIHLTLPLYQNMRFWKGEAYFDKTLSLSLTASPWGQKYRGVSPLSFILSPDWEAKAPYVSLELIGRWFPVRMLGMQSTLGTIYIENSPLRIYLNLGFTVGTSGPVSQQKISPKLEIAGIVFDDALTGNSNGLLESDERGRLLVLLVNRGLQDSDSVTLYSKMRDARLSKYLAIPEIVVPPVLSNQTIEVEVPVFAASRMPAMPLHVRLWGKDANGNLVTPQFIEIPTVGSE